MLTLQKGELQLLIAALAFQALNEVELLVERPQELRLPIKAWLGISSFESEVPGFRRLVRCWESRRQRLDQSEGNKL